MATIRYFGIVAEVTQRNEEYIEIENMNVSEVWNLLYAKYDLSTLNARVALNQRLVDLNSSITINNNDELALLPPFAGG